MTDIINLLPAPLVSLISFIITILFLVTIHEFGHFWVARKFGVRIEKFSIGFGKPIFKWFGKKDNTEYSISWIPLGGYVKMYGETPEEIKSIEIADKGEDFSDITATNSNTGSFFNLHPFKRLLIAVAGPAVNLAFAIFAFWLLLVIGTVGTSAYIGNIDSNSNMAKSGFVAGDRIIKINSEKIATINDAVMSLVDGLGTNNNVVLVDRKGQQEKLELDLTGYPKGSEIAVEKAIGFDWEIQTVIDNLPAIIATVSEKSPAAIAGLKVDDTILALDDVTVKSWAEMVGVIAKSANKKISAIIKRNGKELELTITPSINPNNKEIGYLGVSAKAPDKSLFAKYRATQKYGPIEAIPMAISKTYFHSALLLKMFKRLIVGEASIKNMGGPLTIADYSGKTISYGFIAYLSFLASISLTLAVMNLLPIPALDGGHIMLCIAEIIKGKPLSDTFVNILMRVGISILLSFMAIIIALDFWKYLS